MKSKQKSGTYTATPASIYLPAKPIPADFKQPQDRSSSLPIDGIKTVKASIDEARKRARELILECKRRFKNNDPTGVSVLLNEYPTLIDDPWVNQTFYKLVRSGRYRRPRGRPRGQFDIHPLVMAGLVDKAIHSGEVWSPDEAFGLLEQIGWCSYDTAKRLYYQAKNEERFKAIFIVETDKTRSASDEEIAGLAKADVLQPSHPIIQRFHHPEFGGGECTLFAQDETDNT